MTKNLSLRNSAVSLCKNGNLREIVDWDYPQVAKLLKDRDEFQDISKIVKLEEVNGSELVKCHKQRTLCKKFNVTAKAPAMRQLDSLLKLVEAAVGASKNATRKSSASNESVSVNKMQATMKMQGESLRKPVPKPKEQATAKSTTPPSVQLPASLVTSGFTPSVTESSAEIQQPPPKSKSQRRRQASTRKFEDMLDKENINPVPNQIIGANTKECSDTLQPKIDAIFDPEDDSVVNKRRRLSQSDSRRGLVPPPPTKKRRKSSGETSRLSCELLESNVYQDLVLMPDRVETVSRPVRLVLSFSGKRMGNQWVIEETQQLAVKLESLISTIPEKIKSVVYEHKPRLAATLLIVPVCQDRPTLKILSTLKAGGQILQPSYLSEVLKAQEWPLECSQSFEHPRWPKLSQRLVHWRPLEGFSFYLFGQFNDRDIPKSEVQSLIRFMGGILCSNIRSSDIIILSDGIRELPSTIQNLIKHNLSATQPSNQFVKVEWIIDCLSKWAKVSPELHEPLVVQAERKRATVSSQRETDPIIPAVQEEDDDVESSPRVFNKSEDEIFDSSDE